MARNSWTPEADAEQVLQQWRQGGVAPTTARARNDVLPTSTRGSGASRNSVLAPLQTPRFSDLPAGTEPRGLSPMLAERPALLDAEAGRWLGGDTAEIEGTGVRLVANQSPGSPSSVSAKPSPAPVKERPSVPATGAKSPTRPPQPTGTGQGKKQEQQELQGPPVPVPRIYGGGPWLVYDPAEKREIRARNLVEHLRDMPASTLAPGYLDAARAAREDYRQRQLRGLVPLAPVLSPQAHVREQQVAELRKLQELILRQEAEVRKRYEAEIQSAASGLGVGSKQSDPQTQAVLQRMRQVGNRVRADLSRDAFLHWATSGRQALTPYQRQALGSLLAWRDVNAEHDPGKFKALVNDAQVNLATTMLFGPGAELLIAPVEEGIGRAGMTWLERKAPEAAKVISKAAQSKAGQAMRAEGRKFSGFGAAQAPTERIASGESEAALRKEQNFLLGLAKETGIVAASAITGGVAGYFAGVVGKGALLPVERFTVTKILHWRIGKAERALKAAPPQSRDARVAAQQLAGWHRQLAEISTPPPKSTGPRLKQEAIHTDLPEPLRTSPTVTSPAGTQRGGVNRPVPTAPAPINVSNERVIMQAKVPKAIAPTMPQTTSMSTFRVKEPRSGTGVVPAPGTINRVGGLQLSNQSSVLAEKSPQVASVTPEAATNPAAKTAPEPQPGAVSVSEEPIAEVLQAKPSRGLGSESGLEPDTLIADLKARDYGEQDAWNVYTRYRKGKPELSPEEFRQRFLGAKPKRHLLPEIQAPAIEEARYLAEGLDEGRKHYSGRFNIEKRKTLNPTERAIEAAFVARLEAHPEAFLQEYLRLHDNQINTDLAKELWPDFVASPEGRIKSSNAIYAPAKKLASLAYERLLAETPSAGRRKAVLFTAGGPGAGKSTAIGEVPAAQQAQQSANIIVDGTLSDYSAAKSLIDQALASGHEVAVIYVHRPATTAAVGTMMRARNPKKGWPVPYRRIAEGHFGAQNTVIQLAKEYGDRIDLYPLDNSGNLNEIRGLDWATLGDERYTNLEDLSGRIRDALEAEYRASVQRGDPIPFDLYQAFLGNDARRVGASAPGRGQGKFPPPSSTPGGGSGKREIGPEGGNPGDPEPPSSSASKSVLGIVGAAAGLGLEQKKPSGGNDHGGTLLAKAVAVRGSLKHDTYTDAEGKKRTAKWYGIGATPRGRGEREAMAAHLRRRRPDLAGRTWFVPGVGTGTLQELVVERGVVPAEVGNIYRQDGQKWRSGGGRSGASGARSPASAGS